MNPIRFINDLLDSPAGSDQRMLGMIFAGVALIITVMCIIAIVASIQIHILSPRQERIRKEKEKAENRNKLFIGVTLLTDTMAKLEEIHRKQIDPLDKLVEFYAVSSVLQDARLFAGIDYWMLDDNERDVRSQCISAIAYIGRCEYSYNRTEPGQLVTKDHVFLGNINGIFTNSVRVWQETHRNGGLTGLHKNTYATLQSQAGSIMNGGVVLLKNAVTALRQLQAQQQHC